MSSIHKGKHFEREVAHKLTELTNCKFMRVPMSGAFSTNNNSENPVFDGDVFCENQIYKDLVIECKATSKKILITDIFNEKSLLCSFIKQAREESKGKDWLLIIKMNNITPFFICEYEKFIPQIKYGDIFKNLEMKQLSNYYVGLFK